MYCISRYINYSKFDFFIVIIISTSFFNPIPINSILLLFVNDTVNLKYKTSIV